MYLAFHGEANQMVDLCLCIWFHGAWTLRHSDQSLCFFLTPLQWHL